MHCAYHAPAVCRVQEQLFERKPTKEEKKLAAARKKAERDALKAS